VLVAGLAVGLGPARACACKPVMPDPPVDIQRPTWPAVSGLELVDERIEIICDRARARVVDRCRWRAVWIYAGIEGVAASGELRIRGRVTELDGRVRVDGRAMETSASQSTDPELLWSRLLTVEDAAHVEVEVELELVLRTLDVDVCTNHAGYARHWIVARPPRGASFLVSGDPPPPDTITALRLRAPAGWRIQLDSTRAQAGRKLDASVVSRELHGLNLHNRPLLHGPLIGAGVGFGPQVRARLRAGWEFAAPPFVLYSVAVEGDLARDVGELLVVPAIEVASPSFWGIIPSAALGVGAPVMLIPDPRPGVRVQAALTWPFAGLVANVDIYPADRGAAQALRGSLMIQLSI